MITPVTYNPSHPLLKQHIAYFYFVSGEADFESRYYAFPHTLTVLNIHKKATLSISKEITEVKAREGFAPVALVQGIREHPLLAHLQGKMDKVTILFHPMGLNAFIRKPLGEVIVQSSQVFNCWDEEPTYSVFLERFFSSEDLNHRAKLLEEFLLSVYQPLAEYDLLNKAVELLSDVELELSVEEICEKLHLHPRSFGRLFKKQLGITPIGFRKVARFRRSLADKLVQNRVKRLTELAYASNYYDQAYFNKIYRGLTGSNPLRFFNKIDQLADDRLVLQFLDKK